jgi:hypothetical protein
VTWDPGDQSVLVSELSNGGWLLFTRESLAANKAEMIADQIQYGVTVTCGKPIDWGEHQQSFELARQAFTDPSKIDVAVHQPSRRIPVEVAMYLAMRERVEAWGGFTDERDRLPTLYARLKPEERELVDARLRGESIVF